MEHIVDLKSSANAIERVRAAGEAARCLPGVLVEEPILAVPSGRCDERRRLHHFLQRIIDRECRGVVEPALWYLGRNDACPEMSWDADSGPLCRTESGKYVCSTWLGGGAGLSPSAGLTCCEAQGGEFGRWDGRNKKQVSRTWVEACDAGLIVWHSHQATSKPLQGDLKRPVRRHAAAQRCLAGGRGDASHDAGVLQKVHKEQSVSAPAGCGEEANPGGTAGGVHGNLRPGAKRSTESAGEADGTARTAALAAVSLIVPFSEMSGATRIASCSCTTRFVHVVVRKNSQLELQ